MVVETLVSKEFPVTQMTDGGRFWKLSSFQRSFGLEEIVAVLTFAGGAPFSIAAMITEVFFVVAPVTVIAKVRFAEESSKRVASVVMSIFFDRVFAVLRPYRDEGRPFDTHHSSTPSWAILGYPISPVTWVDYYHDLSDFLRSIYLENPNVSRETLYIRRTVFIPFGIIPGVAVRLTVYRFFYFNTPYAVWHFIRCIRFRLLFVGTTSVANGIAIVRLSLTNEPSDSLYPGDHVLCES